MLKRLNRWGLRHSVEFFLPFITRKNAHNYLTRKIENLPRKTSKHIKCHRCKTENRSAGIPPYQYSMECKKCRAILSIPTPTRLGYAHSVLDTLRLLVWTIPHPLYLDFWIDEQIPAFVQRFGRCWISDRRFSQQLYGKTKPSLAELKQAMKKTWSKAEFLEQKVAA